MFSVIRASGTVASVVAAPTMMFGLCLSAPSPVGVSGVVQVSVTWTL
jgi:hypothetical protein